MNTSIDRDRVSDETLEKSKISSEFLVEYDILEEYKPFLINSFQTIGWSDPFPDEDLAITGSQDDGLNLTIPVSIGDLVYQRSRYVKEHSPLHLYVPKKEIMLKIMRACVGIHKPQDLWFVQKKKALSVKNSFYKD
jgi:hypothetical protein